MVGHAGRWVTDANGRVVVVHGVNVPTKWASAPDPGALGYGDDDAALLAGAGLNAVRLTVERYLVEPAPGVFDDDYVRRMAAAVTLSASHGLLTIIDFHQDSFGPEFFDNGFPSWMTVTDRLPNLYELGFPGQYFGNPALERAFDHFWNNDPDGHGGRLQDDDAAILSHVAGALKGLPSLLGYEILNEPWPGSAYPTCLTPAVGCPTFDQSIVSAYYVKVTQAIRAADPSHLVWYEPLTTFNQGTPTAAAIPGDANIGFAFHDYPLCGAVVSAVSATAQSACTTSDGAEDGTVLTNALDHVQVTGDALLETEFGNTTDRATLEGQLSRYDGAMVPWMFWSYTRFICGYGSDGATLAPAGTNVDWATLTTLARPYPQLVSGTPGSWQYDPSTRSFTLTYTTARADGTGAFAPGAETAIAVPQLAYPAGYRTSVAGGHVISAPGAPVLRIAAAAGATRVDVQVTPA